MPLSAQFSYKVDGIVKYREKAIAGAVVSLYNSSGMEKEVLTNAAGTYSLSLKPNEEYTIFITKPGFTKSEIVVSTMGFTEDDAKKFKGFSKPEIELFDLPSDEVAVAKIKEILGTPLMSYYYDFDKNAIIADESLEESLKDELATIRKIAGQPEKKEDLSAETDFKYKTEIAEGDKLFKAKKYDVAMLSYNQASSIKPAESYPKLRIQEIDKLMADAELNEKLAKERADASKEKERIANEKKLADAAEKERLAKEKALTDAAEKERIAKEKELANAAEKEKMAKEKEMADAAEKERMAKVKALADAAEQARLANEKDMADAAKKSRLAKEKAMADAAELERITKEKENAIASERARIAKEKAMADAAELDRITKEKDLVDAAEREKRAKEKEVADAIEKERLTKEEEVRALNKKYTLAINRGDSAILAKNYTIAKAQFNEALTLKPKETYPTGRIAEIDMAIAKTGEFKNELAKKYPEGVTEEVVKEGNAVVTRRIVVIGNKGVLYLMRRTSFGAVYYFKDDAAISEAEFKKNTEVK